MGQTPSVPVSNDRQARARNDSMLHTLQASFAIDQPAIRAAVISGFIGGAATLLIGRRLVTVAARSVGLSSARPVLVWPLAATATYATGCLASHAFTNISAETFLSYRRQHPAQSLTDSERRFPFQRVSLWPVPGLSLSLPLSSQLTGIACGMLTLVAATLSGGPRGVLTILPSNLFYRGSFARRWLVASSRDYADTVQKRNLHLLGAHYGCHSCGRRINVSKQQREALFRANSDTSDGLIKNLQLMPSQSEPVIGYVGDHIPPSGRNPKKLPQIFLPQCPTCSVAQSIAVRTGRTALVTQYWRRLAWQDLYLPWPLAVQPLAPVLERLASQWT